MKRARRRLLLAALAAPFAAHGQQRPAARIAWLATSPERDARHFLGQLRTGLRELGYAEGSSILIEARWANDSAELAAELAAQAVAARPDVIVTLGPTVFPVSRATRAIPVVFGFSGDPVEAGLVQSLSRPGANLTGIYFLTLDLVGKRLELLKEVMPRLKRVAVLANPQHAGDKAERRAAQAAAGPLGLELEYFEARTAAEIVAALGAIENARVDAALVFPFATMIAQRERIAKWSLEHRIPAVSGWAQFAEGGNLLSYGPNLSRTMHRLATYVDKILKGAKPSDIPVELPSSVELVVNARAAKALGLSIPGSVLLRADRVIE
jgi:putative ABC transport system substrate-binding protein